MASLRIKVVNRLQWCIRNVAQLRDDTSHPADVQHLRYIIARLDALVVDVDQEFNERARVAAQAPAPSDPSDIF